MTPEIYQGPVASAIENAIDSVRFSRILRFCNIPSPFYLDSDRGPSPQRGRAASEVDIKGRYPPSECSLPQTRSAGERHEEPVADSTQLNSLDRRRASAFNRVNVLGHGKDTFLDLEVASAAAEAFGSRSRSQRYP